MDFRIYCYEKNIPIISINTERYLKSILTWNEKILEVWSWIWYSSYIFSKKSSIVYSFERSYNRYIECLKHKKLYNMYNVIFYNFDFLTINKSFFPFKFDIIFIDWMKREYLKYFLKALKLIKKWWKIILDDVIKFKDKMISLYEFLDKNQLNYEILKLDIDDWILIYKYL